MIPPEIPREDLHDYFRYQELGIRHERSLKFRPSPNAPKLTEEERKKLLQLHSLLNGHLLKAQRRQISESRKRYEEQVKWARAEDKRHIGLYIFLSVLVLLAVLGNLFGLMFM